MMTHKELVKKMLRQPAVKAEFEAHVSVPLWFNALNHRGTETQRRQEFIAGSEDFEALVLQRTQRGASNSLCPLCLCGSKSALQKSVALVVNLENRESSGGVRI